LLPGEEAPVERRAPAAIHLAIGRALELVEAPPFASVAEFTAALARLERGSRPELVRAVYQRCIARLTPAHEPQAASSSGAPPSTPATTEKVEKDRRTSGARVDALRRMIRERDHHDYLVRADRLAKRSRMSDGPRARTHGPSVEALRRALREADRQRFEMLRSMASPSTSSRGALVSLLLAVLVAAGLGMAERSSTGSGAPAAQAAPVGVELRFQKRSEGAIRPEEAPQTPMTAPNGGDEPATTASNAGHTDAAVEATSDGVGHEPASVQRGGSVAATPDAPPSGRSTVKRTASSTAKPGIRPARRGSGRRVVASAEVLSNPTAAGSQNPGRRWGPLRLVAAIGRRLSAAF
jgi:hypothetical protein